METGEGGDQGMSGQVGLQDEDVAVEEGEQGAGEQEAPLDLSH